jgi:hypothetical protein
MCTNRFRDVGNGSSSSYSRSKHLSILGPLSHIRFGDFGLKWRAQYKVIGRKEKEKNHLNV